MSADVKGTDVCEVVVMWMWMGLEDVSSIKITFVGWTGTLW
jgi:hypothetical protein